MSSERPATGDPSELLAYLLKHAHQRLMALADAALEPHGLDRKEFGVLRVLAAREPLSQQALAGLLGVDPTTMVAVLDALEDKGIVTRRPDPADRRRNQIALTASGQATNAAAESAYAAAEGEFLGPLGSADAGELRRMLRALVVMDAGAPSVAARASESTSTAP